MILVNGTKIEFEKFPNGETKLIEDNLDFAMGESLSTEVSFKYESDDDLIKLMMVKSYIDTKTIDVFDVKLVIYYMPYSRMDRSENGSAFTLKYISNFINSLKFSMVTVIEPHSDVTPALIDNVEVKHINFDLLPKVMEEIGFIVGVDYIMFPDLGASSRYKSLPVDNVLIGHKNRDFKTGEILNLDLIGENNSFLNKVIIVDDLSSRGGTFVHSAKKLKEEGFENVYLLVAHSENTIFKGELFDHIDKVFTTDSILTEQNNWENKKYHDQLKIYNIEGVLN